MDSLERFEKSTYFQQKKAALIEEITAAFDGVERGDGVTWHEAWVIDNYGSAEARAEARKEDTDTKWQDVPDSHMLNGYSVLSFLDPAGFHYYIPAYITWYLRIMGSDDPGNSSNTPEFLIYALTLSEEDSMYSYYHSRYSLLTFEQSRAIAHFLEFDAEHEEECEKWSEALRIEMLTSEGYTMEEIQALKDEARKDSWLPENYAQYALERYWGQFL